jgi:hypothetical protein
MRKFLENCIVVSCGNLEGSVRVGDVNRLEMSCSWFGTEREQEEAKSVVYVSVSASWSSELVV